MEKYLNIDWLKSNRQMIHFFGLGFIQVKIDDEVRMHFYTPELPALLSEEDVHNHRYDFFSQILKGFLCQSLFEVVNGETHLREQESCKAGVEVNSPPVACGLQLVSEHRYIGPGSAYFIKAETFHRVYARGITLLKRNKVRREFAEVVRPIGSQKVCPFSKKIEENRLWEIVECVIKTPVPEETPFA